jgi:hypothetical protein
MVSAKPAQKETLVARRRYGEVPHSDTGRAEAFSDGVLAIVITLLVLHLKPPPIASGGLLNQLLNQWPTYLAMSPRTSTSLSYGSTTRRHSSASRP